jgi:(p)ppGpp synthase/HD superfamily hydrolase
MNLTLRLQQAINKAAILHLNQIRKCGSGLPYITHPFSVMLILSKYTEEEDTLIAGLLHDAIEDVAGYNYKTLVQDFDWQVADLVRDVTELQEEGLDKKITWLERKKHYLEKLKLASDDALLVCGADKIHNLKSMLDCYRVSGQQAWQSFNAPIDQKIWFYEEVLKIIEDRLGDQLITVDLAEALRETKWAVGL